MGTYRVTTSLAKVESPEGTDASPTVGSDAYVCEGAVVDPNISVINTNEISDSLDIKAPVAGGASPTYVCGVNLKGSGAAGTKPEWGVLLRGCGMAQTITASAITGTAQAGAAGTITLAAGASSVTDFHKGMIITITGGTGSGQTRVVYAYNGGTKIASTMPNWAINPDNTSTYSFSANVMYVPRSSGTEALTHYLYTHNSDAGVESKLQKVLGSRGNVNFSFPSGGIGRANFDFKGRFALPTDVTRPSAATFDATRPPVFLAAQCYLDNQSTPFATVDFGLNADVGLDDDPTDQFGVGYTGFLSRSISGRINPPLALNSVRNAIQDFIDGTPRKMWVRYGSAAGNRISVLFPQILYSGSKVEENKGFAHEGIPFSALGADSGVYLCVY